MVGMIVVGSMLQWNEWNTRICCINALRIRCIITLRIRCIITLRIRCIITLRIRCINALRIHCIITLRTHHLATLRIHHITQSRIHTNSTPRGAKILLERRRETRLQRGRHQYLPRIVAGEKTRQLGLPHVVDRQLPRADVHHTETIMVALR